VAKKKRAEPKPDPEPLRVAAADALEKYLTPEETVDLGLQGTEATVEAGHMRVSDLIRDLRDAAREQRRLAEKLEKAADAIADMKAKYPAFQREQKRLEKAKARKSAKKKQAAEDRKLGEQVRKDRKSGLFV
jgi:hypothetical protein